MIQIWVTYAIIAAAVLSYALERVTMELTSIAALGALLIFFHFFPVTGAGGGNLLGPDTLLEGFANPALIAVIALLVVGQAMFQTGALETPARMALEYGGKFPKLIALGAFALVFLVSAFMNNTPIVVIFIPIMAVIAERLNQGVNRVMMPLSFIAILGGMTTLIGSSTNLLVAGTAARLGIAEIGFFDFTVIGIMLGVIGCVYVIGIMPKILPQRPSLAGEMVNPSGKQFIVQIEIDENHPLLGERSVAGFFRALPDATVRMIERGEKTLLPPFDNMTLQYGDILLVATTRKALQEIMAERPQIMAGVLRGAGLSPEDGSDRPSRPLPTAGRTIAEAMIAPGSRMIGRTIEQIGFRHQTGCLVLGIQRRSRMIRARMDEIRLEPGDVLLVMGKAHEVASLRDSRDVVLLEWSTTTLPDRTHAPRARVIFGLVILASATGLIPIVVAALCGAGLMIATGCLNIRQAARAIDRRILLIVAAAIAMGKALELTGGANIGAATLVDLLDGMSVPVILSAFFLMVALMTNLLSNNATAVLFAPIAVSTATTIGADPKIFLYALIFAANCSFATPIAYQTNLLVMVPGHYRFSDFIRAGIPLLILVWLSFSILAPWYYDLSWQP